MGQGSIYSMSWRQELNTRSSTEAELVGVNNAMSLILWTGLFLLGQGFDMKDNVVLQDNQSTMLLANNGKRSSRIRPRRIEIRYYFVTDKITKKHLQIEYCLTDKYRVQNFENFAISQHMTQWWIVRSVLEQWGPHNLHPCHALGQLQH